MIPMLLGITIVSYIIMNLAPGDAAAMYVDPEMMNIDPNAIEMIREKLGLNQPVHVRYIKWLREVLTGNFGYSYISKQPVIKEIRARLGPTLVLAFLSLTIEVIAGIGLGVYCAKNQYKLSDYVLSVFAFTGMSVPNFWFAMMLILLFSLKWRILPSLGADSWRHFILPAIATSANTLASLLRMTRSTMLEVIRQDYIRTARAKGAKESRVIFGHALRNALLPVVTIIGVNFGIALGGTIVVEQVFALPGLGQLMVNAIRSKDTPMVVAAVLFAAIIASLINLIVDIVYAYIDPRLKSKYVKLKTRKVTT